MERWKDLPPITLDNTTVSYLVTLIPVLVSMTSKDKAPQEPRFEDETEKPAWWPPDVKWRNPKCYMQEKLEKEDRLLVLRKLVHSCYSYHGAEDLLSRLEEMPSPEGPLENADEGLEVIELAEEDDKQDEPTSDADGPVFVCCFCLEQFSSHEEVSTHQSSCLKGAQESEFASSQSASSDSRQEGSVASPVFQSFLGPEEPNESRAAEASDFLDAILCSGASSANLSPALTVSSSNNHGRPGSSTRSPVPTSLSAATSQPHSQPSSAQDRAAKRPAPTPADSSPFVPILKTRSQRKLEQIMLNHSMKKMMLKECREMRAVPRKGAWWRSRNSKPTPPPAHPKSYVPQQDFCSALGLSRAKDAKGQDQKDQAQEVVDLDCMIVSVEGPLSMVPTSRSESDPPQQTSASPRSSKSLMSQLCRGSEEGGRRRLSFRFLEDEWADKEALEEGRDPLQMSLLSIEFSSPLGVRIKKYVGGEGQYNIIKDSEAFCKTEDFDDSHSKLRVRANDYRVTYRRKRRATNFVHKYKFNKSDRREFRRLLQTGLNARSRRLQREMTKCSVALRRMPQSEIKEWTEGKKIIIPEQIIVDDDICITQVDIPESQMRKALIQEKKLSSGYRPGPKCFGGLGKRHPSFALHRPSMALYSPASPPHIPNIFRNRAGHTPSPPIPSSLPHSNRGLPLSRYNGHPGNLVGRESLLKHSGRPVGGFVPHQNNPTSSHVSHLSQHKSLGPSVHGRERSDHTAMSVGGSSSSSNQNFTGHNSPNRRKQQLTQVRRDETDPVRPAPPHSNPFIRKPLAKAPPGHPGTVSSQNGQCKVNPSSSPSFTVSMLGRKLSNFDHFNIRNGKLSAGVSSHGPLPHKVAPLGSSLLAAQRQQQQQQPASGHSPAHRHPSNSSLLHRSRQLPDWSSQQPSKHRDNQGCNNRGGSFQPAPARTNVSSSQQPPQGLGRPTPATQGPQHRQQTTVGQNHRGSYPQQMGSPMSKFPSGSSQVPVKARRQQLPQTKGARDEDIMEVICIDDD